MRCHNRHGQVWGALVAEWTGGEGDHQTKPNNNGKIDCDEGAKSSPSMLSTTPPKVVRSLLCRLLCIGPIAFATEASLSHWISLQDGIHKASDSLLALLCRKQILKNTQWEDLRTVVQAFLSPTLWVHNIALDLMTSNEVWGRQVIQQAKSMHTSDVNVLAMESAMAEHLCGHSETNRGRVGVVDIDVDVSDGNINATTETLQGCDESKGGADADDDLLLFQRAWLTTLAAQSIASVRSAPRCCCVKHWKRLRTVTDLAGVTPPAAAIAQRWLHGNQLMLLDSQPEWLLTPDTVVQVFDTSLRLHLVSLNLACCHFVQLNATAHPDMVVQVWQVARRTRGFAWQTCLRLVRKLNITVSKALQVELFRDLGAAHPSEH